MPPDLSWHRVHASSLAFRLATHVRSLLIPGLVVLWFARGSKWSLIGLVMFLPSILFEILHFISLRYRFDHDEFVLREGLVFRRERHIPFQRIQNLDLVQNVFHRLMRVAEVRLETAGGSEPEAVLRVLSMSAVASMRQHVFEGRGAVAAGGDRAPVAAGAAELDPGLRSDASRVLVRVPMSELARLGLIFNRGLVAVSLAMGFAWELDLLERSDLSRVLDVPFDRPSQSGVVVLALALAIGIPLCLYGLSIVWTILRLFEFTLVRVGDDLQMSCGLLTKRSATIPRHRIQLVTVHQTMLHRLFRRATVRVETAGAVGEDSDAISRKWFVPILSAERVPALLRALDLGIELERLDWRPLAAKAARRMVKKEVALALAAAAGLAALIHPWAAATALAFVPFAVWHALARVRFTRYAPFEAGLAFRSGALNRKTSATLYSKVQVVALHESPFDRRYGMAKLAIDTAGAGPADHKIRVPYLERTVAEELAGACARRAQELAFRW